MLALHSSPAPESTHQTAAVITPLNDRHSFELSRAEVMKNLAVVWCAGDQTRDKQQDTNHTDDIPVLILQIINNTLTTITQSVGEGPHWMALISGGAFGKLLE